VCNILKRLWPMFRLSRGLLAFQMKTYSGPLNNSIHQHCWHNFNYIYSWLCELLRQYFHYNNTKSSSDTFDWLLGDSQMPLPAVHRPRVPLRTFKMRLKIFLRWNNWPRFKLNSHKQICKIVKIKEKIRDCSFGWSPSKIVSHYSDRFLE